LAMGTPSEAARCTCFDLGASARYGPA